MKLSVALLLFIIVNVYCTNVTNNELTMELVLTPQCPLCANCNSNTVIKMPMQKCASQDQIYCMYATRISLSGTKMITSTTVTCESKCMYSLGPTTVVCLSSLLPSLPDFIISPNNNTTSHIQCPTCSNCMLNNLTSLKLQTCSPSDQLFCQYDLTFNSKTLSPMLNAACSSTCTHNLDMVDGSLMVCSASLTNSFTGVAALFNVKTSFAMLANSLSKNQQSMDVILDQFASSVTNLTNLDTIIMSNQPLNKLVNFLNGTGLNTTGLNAILYNLNNLVELIDSVSKNTELGSIMNSLNMFFTKTSVSDPVVSKILEKLSIMAHVFKNTTDPGSVLSDLSLLLTKNNVDSSEFSSILNSLKAVLEFIDDNQSTLSSYSSILHDLNVLLSSEKKLDTQTMVLKLMSLINLVQAGNKAASVVPVLVNLNNLMNRVGSNNCLLLSTVQVINNINFHNSSLVGVLTEMNGLLNSCGYISPQFDKFLENLQKLVWMIENGTFSMTTVQENLQALLAEFGLMNQTSIQYVMSSLHNVSRIVNELVEVCRHPENSTNMNQLVVDVAGMMNSFGLTIIPNCEDNCTAALEELIEASFLAFVSQTVGLNSTQVNTVLDNINNLVKTIESIIANPTGYNVNEAFNMIAGQVSQLLISSGMNANDTQRIVEDLMQLIGELINSPTKFNLQQLASFFKSIFNVTGNDQLLADLAYVSQSLMNFSPYNLTSLLAVESSLINLFSNRFQLNSTELTIFVNNFNLLVQNILQSPNRTNVVALISYIKYSVNHFGQENRLTDALFNFAINIFGEPISEASTLSSLLILLNELDLLNNSTIGVLMNSFNLFMDISDARQGIWSDPDLMLILSDVAGLLKSVNLEETKLYLIVNEMIYYISNLTSSGMSCPVCSNCTLMEMGNITVANCTQDQQYCQYQVNIGGSPLVTYSIGCSPRASCQTRFDPMHMKAWFCTRAMPNELSHIFGNFSLEIMLNQTLAAMRQFSFNELASGLMDTLNRLGLPSTWADMNSLMNLANDIYVTMNLTTVCPVCDNCTQSNLNNMRMQTCLESETFCHYDMNQNAKTISSSCVEPSLCSYSLTNSSARFCVPSLAQKAIGYVNQKLQSYQINAIPTCPVCPNCSISSLLKSKLTFCSASYDQSYYCQYLVNVTTATVDIQCSNNCKLGLEWGKMVTFCSPAFPIFNPQTTSTSQSITTSATTNNQTLTNQTTTQVSTQTYSTPFGTTRTTVTTSIITSSSTTTTQRTTRSNDSANTQTTYQITTTQVQTTTTSKASQIKSDGLWLIVLYLTIAEFF